MNNVSVASKKNERPRWLTPEQRKEALASVVDQFRDYGKPEEVLNDLVSCTTFESNLDGYKLARELERLGWEADAGLVDTLDGLYWPLTKRLTKAVEDWVHENGIVPQHQVGEIVTFKDKGKSIKGEIIQVDESSAIYYLFCESLGHVREGVGVHSRLIPFEEVQS